MGCCFSYTTTTTTTSSYTTALIITFDGCLREYSVPVTVSSVLGPRQASSFLCSSDRLYFDNYIPALGLDVGLRSGQVYFEMPMAKLDYPLSKSDMAAMAIKASSAISAASKKRDCDRSRRLKIMPIEEACEEGRVGNRSVSGWRKGRVEFQPCRNVKFETIIEVDE